MLMILWAPPNATDRGLRVLSGPPCINPILAEDIEKEQKSGEMQAYAFKAGTVGGDRSRQKRQHSQLGGWSGFAFQSS